MAITKFSICDVGGLALHCLTVERGFTVYAPQIIGRPLWRGRAGEQRTELLFDNYVFILIVEQCSPAAYCPGVRHLLCGNGPVPLRVPDQVIASLKAREGSNGLIKLPSQPPPAGLRRGDTVRVVRGAFENC